MRRLSRIAVLCLITITLGCVKGQQPPENAQGNLNSNTTNSAATEQVSDEELASRIKLELAANERTSGLDIQIQASGGAVTLSGTVNSEEAKAAAAEIASKLARNVNDQLQVAPEVKPNEPQVSDKDIQAALERIINQDEKISSLPLSWNVRDGVVTLDGIVETNEELAYAVQVISKIPGVKSVKKSSVTVTGK
jgi:osmotically-inducible protein OsmY